MFIGAARALTGEATVVSTAMFIGAAPALTGEASVVSTAVFIGAAPALTGEAAVVSTAMFIGAAPALTAAPDESTHAPRVRGPRFRPTPSTHLPGRREAAAGEVRQSDSANVVE